MKFKSFNRVLAALLMLTMLAGQVLMSTAMALNEEPGIVILDESDLLEAEPTPTPEAEPPEGGELPAEGGMPTPGAAETIEISEDDLTATPTPMPVEPTDTPEASPTIEPTDTPLLTATLLRGFNLMSNNPDELTNGGIKVSVICDKQGQTIYDGEKCTLTITVKDDDLNTEPNIQEGTEIKVKLPGFLQIEDIDAAMKGKWGAYFKEAKYDAGTNTLTLIVKKTDADGTVKYITATIETTAHLAGYDGDETGKIEIGVGNIQEAEIDIGTGTGTGETQTALNKIIYGNYREGTDRGQGVYLLDDPNKAITYQVNFGVSKNYTNQVVLTDTLSNGELALCDSQANTNVSLDKSFRLFIDGKKYVSPETTEEKLEFKDTPLGTITIEKKNTGFTVTCEYPDSNSQGADAQMVNVSVRYFAKVVGHATNVTNTVDLAINGEKQQQSSVTARKYDAAMLLLNKYIIADGNAVRMVDINSKKTEKKQVTFRISITQYGDDATEEEASIADDVLSDCFSFVGGLVKYGPENANEFLSVEHDDGKISIKKKRGKRIPAGTYTIDFTVNVDMNKLQPGDAAQNKISESNVVYIRRDAELTVNKTWEDDEAGKEATFQLIGPKGDIDIIDTATVTENGSATLYIGADKLSEGDNTCTLRETVEESSAYVAGPDKKVVINKKDNVVTIVSVEDEYVNKGTASVSIENKLDSQKGSVTFRKYGEDNKPLDGGTFQLYRVDGENSDPVGKVFSTANGEHTIDNLLYGTYYVQEISAPAGYILASTPSQSVTIKKTNAHATIEMTNEKYTAGAITIKKVDEKNNPLAGAEFMLSPGGNSEITGANGIAAFEGLAEGTYTIIETKSPTGYGKLEGLEGSVTVNIQANGTANVEGTVPDNFQFDGKSVKLTWKNTRTHGSISITKTGSANKPLQDAVFGLYKDADAAGDTEIIKSTGKDGKALFADLAAGTYYVKEIAAPNGYVLDEIIRPFTIGGNDAWDVKTDIENSLKQYTLKLTKKGDDEKLLEGVEFTLSGTGIVPMTAESGKDGVVKFEGLPFGRYTIAETKAPQGYVPAGSINVEVKGDGSNGSVIQVGDVINKRTKLTVTKFAEDGKTKLPGAEFIIRNGKGNYVTADGTNFVSFTDNKQNATKLTTGSDGTFTLEYLPLGEYVLEEIKAPEGYIIVTASKDFEIKNSETRVSINNTKIKTGLKIIKTDENGKLLEGIKFTLKNSADGFVKARGSKGRYTYTGLANNGTELVTDERGEILISGLLWGKYYLSETAVPKGIVGIKDQIVEVDAENHNKTIELKLENRSEKEKIEFKKTDGAGNGLAGAVFKLKLVEGSGTAYSTVRQMYAISDDQGRVSFEDVPYGVYELTEVIAPEGYERGDEKYYVNIGGATADGKNIDIVPDVWLNSRTEKEFTVKKVSADGGELLSGAVFQVLDEGKKLIEGKTITTLNGGSGTVTLPLGKYFLQETAAPEGYEPNEELIPFEVTTNGRNTVTVKNTPKTSSLTIQKRRPMKTASPCSERSLKYTPRRIRPGKIQLR